MIVHNVSILILVMGCFPPNVYINSSLQTFVHRSLSYQDNPEALEWAIREMLKTHDAVFDMQNRFGDMYRIEGTLKGVNEHDLLVVTVWIMRTEEEGLYRFVTLKPWRRKNNAT